MTIRRTAPQDDPAFLLSIGRMRLEDLPAEGGDDDGHQGGDDVEEAEGGVGEGGDGEDGGLGHAAGGPGEEWRGDRGGVLDGAAEEPGLIPPGAEGFSEDVGCQQDGQVLVRDDAVQGGTRDDCRCYQSGAGAREGIQEPREAGNHAAGLHAGAEAHRAKDQEHGIEHAQHAARGQQPVDLRMPRLQRERVVDAFHRADEEAAGARALGDLRADAFDDPGLEDKADDGGHEHGDGEHGQRRHPSPDEHQRHRRHKEQPRGDLEFCRQHRGVKVDLGGLRPVMRQAQDGEDDEGDHHRRDRCEEHVADVREERDLIDGSGHDRRVRQRGDLVAEVGTGDDGAGDHAVGKAFGPADAEKGDADGGDGGPRAARHHRNHGADDAGRQQEHLGTDDLDAVVDEGGNHAAHGPCARNRADEEEDEGGAGDIGKVAADGRLEGLPRGLEEGR